MRLRRSNVERLADINSRATYRIGEVYGSLPGRGLSARPDHLLPAVSAGEFDRYVADLREANVAFNYLINAPIRPHDLVETLQTAKWAADRGVRRFTATDVRLIIELSKLGHEITISTIAGVRDRAAFRVWACLPGVSAVCLVEDLNRNIDALRQITRETGGVDVETIVNGMCLLDCPVRAEHYASIAQLRRGDVDRYGTFCDQVRLGNPVEIFKAPWILPRDLPLLEEAGVTVFKLAGRELMSSSAYKFIEAYALAEYDDDLLELLFLGNPGNYTALTRVSAADIRGFVRSLHSEVRQCARSRCQSCGFCESWAELAGLHLDSRAAQLFRERLADLRSTDNASGAGI